MQNGHRASNPCNMLLVLAIGVSYVRPRFSAFFILGHSHPCINQLPHGARLCIQNLMLLLTEPLTVIYPPHFEDV